MDPRWHLALTATLLIVVPILVLSAYAIYQACDLYVRGIEEQMTAGDRMIGVVVAPLIADGPDARPV